MVVKVDSNTLTKEVWRSLGMISAREEWEDINTYINYLIHICHIDMETYSKEELPKLQGKLIAYRELLALNNKAKKQLNLIK